MTLFLTILCMFFALFLSIMVYCKYEYQTSLKKKAKRYKLTEIDNFIEKEELFIEGCNPSGGMLENALDNIDMWKQVKKYKEEQLLKENQ